ncbi:uncharacterized protein LOC122850854 [Aphidius gifuensis]|uniref:uncharacterized protein LOC122850854 n=1 Tax=Aphidius gifuensis TaxID=684658 RepID=UPI001CDBE7FA|nr:uncharacterized protein LOC122850854 [Aphidius gifuensis]
MMHKELQQAMLINNEEVELEMQLLFTTKSGMDDRRYNVQRINEVAAIFSTTANGDIPESYVSIHNKNTKKLEFVSTMNPNVEPWVYPLLYPYGTRGWHKDIPCVNRSKRVSRTAYIKYRMATRNDNVFLLAGRLFQLNQKKIRADTYQGLIDHLRNKANETNGSVGKIVILPSTFTGSPRNMLQHYQDAMAIVRKFGKPDLFITMTCNPNWREIKENLLDGQTASDRPDIVSRVFEIKKNELIKKIVKENLFGEIQAYVYAVEYQKRGLLHVHALFTLKQNSKITTATIVDEYISAEIPDQTGNINIYNIVMKNMNHGPCGSWYENGYPTYRRRTGVFESPAGGRHDAASIVITNSTDDTHSVNNRIDHDEISNHIETRYVSHVRIYGRPLQEKSHSIARLPVHLPNQQTVTINDEAEEESLRTAMDQQTMLMDYFSLNSGQNISWHPRQKQFNVIGRMYSTSPSQIELFHLRLLLITVKGATSFENLRTINGILHDTYRSACLTLGLIEDDEEWNRAMTEGEVWMMPKQLRHLFVRILIYCSPVKPEKIWENHEDSMCEDFKRNYSLAQSQTKAYYEIINLLEKSKKKKVATMAFTGNAAILLPEGRTMHNLFGMPVPMYADSTSNIKHQPKAAEEIRSIDVIICDEAPMVHVVI